MITKSVSSSLFASSSSVYGKNKKIPFNENDRVDEPISLYAATKKSNELMAYSYASLYEIPITCKMPTDSGLWVGTANVDQVRHDISFFRETEDGGVVEEDGKAVYDGINQTYGNVSDSYPLRYIFF